MVASVPQRMHQSTVYFERTDRFLSDAEFDFARAEDKDCTSEAKVQKLAELYYAKAQRTGATEQVPPPSRTTSNAREPGDSAH